MLGAWVVNGRGLPEVLGGAFVERAAGDGVAEVRVELDDELEGGRRGGNGDDGKENGEKLQEGAPFWLQVGGAMSPSYDLTGLSGIRTVRRILYVGST